ncbi:helix-turn-helix domain-containing protein [Streptomyces zingiberis]|uniref:Helix-turn-helix domain-containing protein n=1 Tax=Streptomyces zingiberis TaxID=2053010 RepID=A0ABX1C120_9ACTN|nr:helix-turn-helix transcriptional regulator [Streptomyces zingiberis]NJQ03615.1 helix-turn-helix domain-containing protein [Streptomyces zingiberis]
MTQQPKDLDPYTSPKTFYGAELRRLREAAGLSQSQLGERVFCSGTYIGQFEAAVRRPQPDVSKSLDEALDTGRHLQRLCKLARRSKHPDYFADAAELEKLATTISEYAPMLIPGLLQTEAYARAVTRATLPLAPDTEVEEHVRARLDRQLLLAESATPRLWAVLHETVLRVPMGGASTMREQLLHLATLVRNRRIILQVLTFDAASHALFNGMASLLSFHDAPPIIYTEGAGTGQLIEDPALVEQGQRSYDLVRAAALSPVASLTLLESVAEDYGSDELCTRRE